MRTTTGDNVSKEQRILLRSASTLAQKEKVGLQRKRRDIKRDRQRGRRQDREAKEETNEHFLVASEKYVWRQDLIEPEATRAREIPDSEGLTYSSVDDYSQPPLVKGSICEW
jgi:hypothetical protein